MIQYRLYEVSGDLMRLDKFLAHAGYGTRKEVKVLIKNGIINVNGEFIKDAGFHINENEDEVFLFNEPVDYQKNVYIMLNKPSGCVSATVDNKHKTVIDIISEEYYHLDLFPIGRLDIDTEGLLLISNDGKLAHHLLSPKNKISKVYRAKVNGIPTAEEISKLEKGIVIRDKNNVPFLTKPAKVIIETSDSDTSICKIEICEGKFHQVKRMFLEIGKEVLHLERLEFATLKLDSELQRGEYRELTEEEINKLTNAKNK